MFTERCKDVARSIIHSRSDRFRSINMTMDDVHWKMQRCCQVHNSLKKWSFQKYHFWVNYGPSNIFQWTSSIVLKECPDVPEPSLAIGFLRPGLLPLLALLGCYFGVAEDAEGAEVLQWAKPSSFAHWNDVICMPELEDQIHKKMSLIIHFCHEHNLRNFCNIWYCPWNLPVNLISEKIVKWCEKLALMPT